MRAVAAALKAHGRGVLAAMLASFAPALGAAQGTPSPPGGRGVQTIALPQLLPSQPITPKAIPELAASKPISDDTGSASAALGRCLHLEALEYDDHISDASTIARATLAVCFAEEARRASAMEITMAKAGVYLNPEQSQQRQEKEDLNFALLMVLRERREWSTASASAPAPKSSTPSTKR